MNPWTTTCLSTSSWQMSSGVSGACIVVFFNLIYSQQSLTSFVKQCGSVPSKAEWNPQRSHSPEEFISGPSGALQEQAGAIGEEIICQDNVETQLVGCCPSRKKQPNQASRVFDSVEGNPTCSPICVTGTLAGPNSTTYQPELLYRKESYHLRIHRDG